MTKSYCPNTNPVQVLRDAADYLEVNGWIQHDFFVRSGMNDEPTQACALGAIQIAVVGVALDVFSTFNVGAPEFDTTVQAAGFVVDHLRQQHDTAQLSLTSKTTALAKWNDRHGRTVAEVVTAMREAADRHSTLRAVS